VQQINLQVAKINCYAQLFETVYLHFVHAWSEPSKLATVCGFRLNSFLSVTCTCSTALFTCLRPESRCSTRLWKTVMQTSFTVFLILNYYKRMSI